MPIARPHCRSSRTCCFNFRIRSLATSGSVCPTHWKGVCGLGTKAPMLMVQPMSRWPAVRRPVSITRCARSAIASTSSSVSVGRPHMK